MEKEKLSFHTAVRAGYRSLAKKYPRRCHLIDASRSRDEIHENICSRLF
jgi:dTMP kinase